MPYFNVHLDKDELLEELDDNDLIRELRNRQKDPNITKHDEKRDLLNECSMALRKANKVALAFRLDELRNELEEMACT